MRKLNPFANIPTIMRAEEIIEFAHKKSIRLSFKSSFMLSRLERAKTREVGRLREFVRHVKLKMKSAVEDFPSLERLHPFYIELSDILVGNDKLKQALGAIYNSIPPIDEIADNHLSAMKKSDDVKKVKRLRSAAKGRIASILRATSANFDFIIEARSKLSQLPGIDFTSPTIVCAGFPNVGKSTIVRQVSTAEPEIAYYPFTTRKVIVGHLKVGNHSVQIVDTPGILDRPMSERNEIEKEGIAALKYLADVIIFVMDASETCGWPLIEQFNLHQEVRRMFPLIPLLVVFNKVDITPPERLVAAKKHIPDSMDIIATEGTGLQSLMEDAVEAVDLPEPKDSVDEYRASLAKKRADPTD